MGLRDIVRKKDDLGNADISSSEAVSRIDEAPEFKLIRTDTHTQEIVHPPNAGPSTGGFLAAPEQPQRNRRRSLGDVFSSSSSRSRSASVSSNLSTGPGSGSNTPGRSHRRLSQRLHLSRAPSSSEHVPQDLPEIEGEDGREGATGAEHQWEKRATMLASATDIARSGLGGSRPETPTESADGGSSSKAIDADIQEAIRLHEEGELGKSTAMFGRLADPSGANNPLSQVLYGLALRHGWGCSPDVEKAVTYLTAAASNAASVEQLALKAGLKKGGAAKGELVLAIFELGNSFRHGWGTNKDPIAAKQYYETAANLGDTDAMNETAWCYLEGFGCKKDKFAAARYYRMAEDNGNPTMGNSWIWKDKYDPKNGGKKK